MTSKRTPSRAFSFLCVSPPRAIGPSLVNRIDQRDEVADTREARPDLVFGLTDGPGDNPASPPLAMSVIFEIRAVGDPHGP